jgi:hypothetical protein
MNRVIILLVLVNAWSSALGIDTAFPQTWISARAATAEEISSNYFEQIDLTVSAKTNVPNSSTYSNNSIRLLLRNREGVIALASARGFYGGKIMANYDVRSDGGVNRSGLTQKELYRVWQTNQTLFKACYYRGPIRYLHGDSFTHEWITVFSSEDRRHVVFARDAGPIFYSENTGASWNKISQPGNYEFTLATSPKGSVMIAALSFTNLSVANIADEEVSKKNWYAEVSAADGSKLVLTGGPSQSTPLLEVTQAGGNMFVSWSSSFTGFMLQENSDLTATNWANVTNTVNLIDSQFVVTLPITDNNYFFRLKTP